MARLNLRVCEQVEELIDAAEADAVVFIMTLQDSEHRFRLLQQRTVVKLSALVYIMDPFSIHDSVALV